MKKILLVELAGIGDAVLSSPAIKNLRKNFPEAKIYYLTFAGPAEILRKSPYLDKVFVVRRGLKGIIGDIPVLKELRKMHIDVAVNMYQHYTLGGALNMALLLKLVNAVKTYGRNTDGKGFFYDVKIEDAIKTARNDAEYKLDLIKALGCNIGDKRLEVWFDDSDKNAVRDFLEKHSISDTDLLIGMNPGAHRLTHRWDWENFARVAETLAKRHGGKIIITGSQDEHWLAEKIRRKISAEAINTAGVLSLTQLAAFMKRCNLYITNDTGPMHIANASGTRMVAIMGTNVLKTAPYQKDKCVVLNKNVECVPCYKANCGNME